MLYNIVVLIFSFFDVFDFCSSESKSLHSLHLYIQAKKNFVFDTIEPSYLVKEQYIIAMLQCVFFLYIKKLTQVSRHICVFYSQRSQKKIHNFTKQIFGYQISQVFNTIYTTWETYLKMILSHFTLQFPYTKSTRKRQNLASAF